MARHAIVAVYGKFSTAHHECKKGLFVTYYIAGAIAAYIYGSSWAWFAKNDHATDAESRAIGIVFGTAAFFLWPAMIVASLASWAGLMARKRSEEDSDAGSD